jgi:hypothetical protein
MYIQRPENEVKKSEKQNPNFVRAYQRKMKSQNLRINNSLSIFLFASSG